MCLDLRPPLLMCARTGENRFRTPGKNWIIAFSRTINRMLRESRGILWLKKMQEV